MCIRDRYLVESIDENGYLTADIPKVARCLKTTEEQVEKVIDVIQTFEPLGVGARSLKECLSIQRAAKGLLEDSRESVSYTHRDVYKRQVWTFRLRD